MENLLHHADSTLMRSVSTHSHVIHGDSTQETDSINWLLILVDEFSFFILNELFIMIVEELGGHHY